ncbi:TPA: hypothetical protein EYO57_30595 [Candidatus Poribacteria bacterium]|nr:hypothetical protein [Candidatus Poribacteria bacterium]
MTVYYRMSLNERKCNWYKINRAVVEDETGLCNVFLDTITKEYWYLSKENVFQMDVRKRKVHKLEYEEFKEIVRQRVWNVIKNNDNLPLGYEFTVPTFEVGKLSIVMGAM